MSYLLLTGSTGMLGSYLLRDLLIAREPVAVVVRDRATETAESRIEALIQYWERELHRYLPRPRVIVGNLHQPSLSVASGEQDWLAANCTRVLHCAACVSFQPEPATGEPFRSNLEGTRHVLQLCEQLGVRNFFHVSTAYLGGSDGEKHFEQAVDPEAASFRNDYEESKALAEQLVRSAPFLDEPTFLRPSIIVGDSQTGFAASYRGIYTALRLGYLHLLAKLQEGWKLDLDLVREVVEGQFIQLLGLDGSERKDLVPVDWVSQAVLHLVSSPSARGGTYHLTSAEPTRIDAMAEAMISAALQSLESQTSKKTGIPTALMESVGFREHMETYQPYFSDDPKFDRANLLREEAPPCPALDHETLVRLWRTSIEADFSWRPTLAKSSVLEVGERLASLPSHVRSGGQSAWTEGLSLELSGPGGGCWHIAFEGVSPAAVTSRGGLPEQCTTHWQPDVYASTATFSALVDQSLDVGHAICSGKLVLTGRASEQAGRERLSELLAFLRVTDNRAHLNGHADTNHPLHHNSDSYQPSSHGHVVQPPSEFAP